LAAPDLPGCMTLEPQKQATGEVIRVAAHALNDEQQTAHLREALIRLDDSAPTM
jgi:hypothetical protein